MVGIHHAPRAPDMVPGRARGGSRGRVRGWVGMTGGVMGRREDMLKRGQGVCVMGGWEEGPPEPHPLILLPGMMRGYMTHVCV